MSHGKTWKELFYYDDGVILPSYRVQEAIDGLDEKVAALEKQIEDMKAAYAVEKADAKRRSKEAGKIIGRLQERMKAAGLDPAVSFPKKDKRLEEIKWYDKAMLYNG